MDRRILPFATALAALAAVADPASGQVVEILPQIGVTSIDYSVEDLDSSTGAAFEIGGKVRIGPRFYVEPGIFYKYGGGTLTDGTDEGDLDIGDFRFPVVVGLKVVASRVLELRVFGGGNVAFVTTASGSGALEEVEKDDIAGTLWGARAGAGVDFTLITVDVGYDWGLTNMVADPEPDDPELKTNGFFIEAGLRFGF